MKLNLIVKYLIGIFRSNGNNRLWFVFCTYLLALGFSISHHELWGDEIHSWNIAKASKGFVDLMHNTRYEGHPPLWYFFLFILSKFSRNVSNIQILHFCICALMAFIFIFRGNLKLIHKILVLFGYYFLYEYGSLSRNYSIGVLLAFVLCVIIEKNFKYKYILYYCLLFLLSNSHFIAFILAFSFHVYFLWPLFLNKEEKLKFLIHGLIGIIVLLPALYFIFPPQSSSLNTGFWLSIWNKDQLFITVQTPLKALFPIPAWWKYHFWNTNALIEAQKIFSFLKFVNPLLSLTLVLCSLFVLYANKRVLLFFSLNLLLTLCFAMVFPLNSARYVGYIFVSFIVALWLANTTILTISKRITLYTLFTFQFIGAFIALEKDWRLPFSHSNEVKKICAIIPENDHLITDYWCLNYLSAFMDKPIYCLGFNREKSFLLWDTEMAEVAKKKDIYVHGMNEFLMKNKKSHVYFITNTIVADIEQRDSLFFRVFDTKLIIGQNDAIEKYSNIYLYKVSSKNTK